MVIVLYIYEVEEQILYLTELLCQLWIAAGGGQRGKIYFTWKLFKER